jgi:hypothetical protein
MQDTDLTGSEQLALAQAIARRETGTAAKRAVLKSLVGAGAILKDNDITLDEALDALSEGTNDLGSKTFLKTISVLTKFLTPWGALFLLVLGIYQAIQTARGSATGFMTLVNKMLSFATPIQAFKAAVGKIFQDAAVENDPATGLSGVATLLAAEVPLLGIMIRSLESSVATPSAKDNQLLFNRTSRTLNSHLGPGGYDAHADYPESYDVEDNDEPMFDEQGTEMEVSDIEPGDIAYDAEGNRYVVDGNLDFVETDIAYDAV